MTPSLTTLSAVEIAAAVRDGRLSACDVTAAHVARIEALNPRLKAVYWPLFDEARRTAASIDARCGRGEALGPLAGVPLLVKDAFATAGAPITLGIGARRGHTASVDGPLVAALRAADAVVIGRTNVPQLMLSFETENSAFGRTLHPERDDRGCGGSSGGDAAAVAAGLAPLSLASDLLGSIRQPAHVCGVHGFKPTMGRMSTIGGVNALTGMEGIVAQAGPIARTVADLEVAIDVLRRAGTSDPYVAPVPWGDAAAVDLGRLRVGLWNDDPLFTPSPAVVRATQEAAEALRAQGAEVVPFRPEQSERGWRLCLGLISAAGAGRARRLLAGEPPIPLVARALSVWNMPRAARSVLAASLDALGQPWRAKVVRASRATTVEAYWELIHDRREYVRAVTAQLDRERIDLLVAPPHGLPALLRGTSAEVLPAAVYSFLPNLLGLPCGTVAATRVRPDEETRRPESRERVQALARRNELQSAGLPVGVQICARLWRDDVCLAAMRAVEAHFAKNEDYPPRRLQSQPGE